MMAPHLVDPRCASRGMRAPVLLTVDWLRNIANSACDCALRSHIDPAWCDRAHAYQLCGRLQVNLFHMNRDERVAFFINIYNALVVHAMALFGPAENTLKRCALVIHFQRFLCLSCPCTWALLQPPPCAAKEQRNPLMWTRLVPLLYTRPASDVSRQATHLWSGCKFCHQCCLVASTLTLTETIVQYVLS